MNFRSALTLCIGSLAVAGGANASDVLVFDNGAGGAAGSNNSIVSDRSFPNFSADDFLLSSATTITRVEWTGRYGGTPNATDDFTIAFFEDDGSGGASGFGLPNSATQVSFDVGNNVNRTASEIGGIFSYSADVSFNAAADTRYFVSIFENTTTDSIFFRRIVLSDVGDDSANNDSANLNSVNSTDLIGWRDNGNRDDFRLYAVPEPGSLAAFGMGAFFLTRRRRMN